MGFFSRFVSYGKNIAEGQESGNESREMRESRSSGIESDTASYQNESSVEAMEPGMVARESVMETYQSNERSSGRRASNFQKSIDVLNKLIDRS